MNASSLIGDLLKASCRFLPYADKGMYQRLVVGRETLMIRTPADIVAQHALRVIRFTQGVPSSICLSVASVEGNAIAPLMTMLTYIDINSSEVFGGIMFTSGDENWCQHQISADPSFFGPQQDDESALNLLKCMFDAL